MKKLAVLTAALLLLAGCAGEMPAAAEAPPEEPVEISTELPTQIPTQPPTEAPTEPQPEHFLLTFVGDCTLGSNYKKEGRTTSFQNTIGQDYDYPMVHVRDYFVTDDYSFANLEGTLGDKGKIFAKDFIFRGDAAFTQILTRGGVEGVTLANNHSMDYRQEGYDETKRILEEAGLDYVEHLGTTMVTTESGLAIGLFAVDFLRGEPGEEEIRAAIGQLRENGAELIVCAYHWGRENTYRPTKDQIRMGRLTIDAGADIVWGHHPHVLQPVEEYNGGVIYYSLGNFVFGGNTDPEDYDTAILRQEVIRQPDGTVTLGQRTAIPCALSSYPKRNNYQPIPYAADSGEYARAMRKLTGEFTGNSLTAD